MNIYHALTTFQITLKCQCCLKKKAIIIIIFFFSFVPGLIITEESEDVGKSIREIGKAVRLSSRRGDSEHDNNSMHLQHQDEQ